MLALRRRADSPDSLSIGFTFLEAASWGGATNFALKRLMLDHAFAVFGAVWFHIAPSNLRSQKVTAKLGTEPVYDATLDLAGSATPWMCFRLSRDAWRRTVSASEVAREAFIPQGDLWRRLRFSASRSA